jgi:flagellar motor switch protein FliN/FliY
MLSRCSSKCFWPKFCAAPADNDTAAARDSFRGRARLQSAMPDTYSNSISDPLGFSRLPPYSRSLLRIRVPVTVTLAATKQPVQRILELGPGTIIQFDKPCDEMLTLEVGNQSVAVGEAVKVGDKFGLRITSITLPGERFWAVKGSRSAEDGPDEPG